MRPAASPPRFFRRDRLVLAGLLLGVPAVLIVAFAAQLVFAVAVPWDRALAIALTHWVVPFGVLLLGAGLTQLAPLARGRLAWALPLHVVACAIVVTVAGHLEEGRIAPLRGLPGMRGPPPPEGIPAEPPDPGLAPGRRAHGGPPRHLFAMIASSRWQLYLATYGVSVSLATAWRMRRQAEARERRALELAAGLSQAKLEALRLQLQPHFLFNALNAITTLVHKDAAAADEMITNLSDLLRAALATTDAEVPLRRELDLLDRYLAIERVRLGERLRVVREIADDVWDAAVPPLMLQTLVENAVRHGVEPRREPGTITIRAERAGAGLRLVVADDGVGLPAADARTERRGLGLANTEARLHELYGGAARLTLQAPPAGGTRVEIELPWKGPRGGDA